MLFLEIIHSTCNLQISQFPVTYASSYNYSVQQAVGLISKINRSHMHDCNIYYM